MIFITVVVVTVIVAVLFICRSRKERNTPAIFAIGGELAEARRAETGAQSATDYVLVARRAALTLQFERLVTDLMTGFEILSRQSDRPKSAAAGSIDAR